MAPTEAMSSSNLMLQHKNQGYTQFNITRSSKCSLSDDHLKLKMFCNNTQCFELIKKITVVIYMRWRLRGAMNNCLNPGFEDIKLCEHTFGKKELGIKARSVTTVDLNVDLPKEFKLRKNNPNIYFLECPLPESISRTKMPPSFSCQDFEIAYYAKL